MRSAEELRADALRLRESLAGMTDPALKEELASQSLELSQRAEALVRLPADTDGIRAEIERYRRTLASSIDNAQRQTIERMVQDAEELLKHLPTKR